MVGHFKRNQIKWIKHNGVETPFCPECFDHNHGDMEVKDMQPKYYDCKNTFGDQREAGTPKAYGQCCCYSKEHGIREKR